MSTNIYFNYGAMNSGKSLELIKVAYNYAEQGHSTLVLKPNIDTRMPGFIYSRTGLKLPAVEIDCTDSNDLKKVLDRHINGHFAILVEECNFLTPDVIDTIIDYAYEHDLNSVLFYGLKVDFRGELFAGTKRVIERADKIQESTSVCWCGKKARQNARVINGQVTKDGPTVMIDDDRTKVEYVTLCNYHFYCGQLKK